MTSASGSKESADHKRTETASVRSGKRPGRQMRAAAIPTATCPMLATCTSPSLGSAGPLLPARGPAGEPRGQFRLALRRRRWLSRGFADLPFQFLIVGQACQLVDEHQRVLRGDLEFLATRLARHLVVEAEEVIAQLGELGPVRFVGARRRPVLLRAANPSDGVSLVRRHLGH